MIPSGELLERILARYPGTDKLSDEENDTARNYRIPGFRGSFGSDVFLDGADAI